MLKVGGKMRSIVLFFLIDIFIIDCGEYLYFFIMNIIRGIWGVRDINIYLFDIYGY